MEIIKHENTVFILNWRSNVESHMTGIVYSVASAGKMSRRHPSV